MRYDKITTLYMLKISEEKFMIEAKNLKKIYKTKKGVVVNALDDVSVKLPDTGMVFILGKSGSGKSTLLNVLGGLDSFDAGEIIIKGTSAKAFKQSHYDSYRNTYIGFIFQEYNVLEELTVGANVALAIELQGRKATNDEINEILKEVDLEGYGNRKPNELSGGQKQRVAIARALVKKPEIIMADEPTGALDSATGKQVFDTLKKLSKSKLVLIVSHDREFSEQYADRIIELKDGVIISDVEKQDGENDLFIEETEENISYLDNEISVKKGYTLTEEDRIAINQYLAALSGDATIKLRDKKSKRKISSDAFVPTDESKIKSDKKGDFKLIKSKLSMKNAFKLGSSALKYKKVRLVFTIFLSLISFALFGLADTIAAYDNISTATQSIFDTGVNYASYIKNHKHYYGDGDFYWDEYGYYLSENDINTLKENTGLKMTGVYNKNANLEYKQHLASGIQSDGNDYTSVYGNSFSGVASITSEMLSDHNFTLLGTNSRLPAENANEIVITKFVYDHFEKVGVAYANEKNEYTEMAVTSPDDVIGKSVWLSFAPYGQGSSKEYKIVGIVDTNFDYERYLPLADKNAEINLSMLEMMTLTSELAAARDYSFACVVFVNPSVINEIIDEVASGADRIEGGNVEMFTVDDADKYETLEDIWEYMRKEEIGSTAYFSSLMSLDKIKNSVVWHNKVDSLKDNQVILGISYAINSIIESNKEPEFFYNHSSLQDFERTLYEKYETGEWGIDFEPTLYQILTNAKTVATYKYAYEHFESVKQLIAEKLNPEKPTDEPELDISTQEVFVYFRNLVESGEIDLVTNEDAKSYYDSLISKYKLTDIILPDSVRELVTVSVEYQGYSYVSLEAYDCPFKHNFASEYRYITAKSYAMKNFEDAKRYFALIENFSDEDMKKADFWSIVNIYSDYLLGNMKTGKNISFTPAADESYGDYMMNVILELYNQENTGENDIILSIDAYKYNSKSELIKDIEIVGFFDNVTSYNRSDAIVISDRLANMLLGPNVDAIYKFAVGVMPNSLQGIKEQVKFAKTFENDRIRYQLKNNVTQQLDMVDEILEVLGKVFLYVGLGFALFAALMLSNFIATSVSHKKQEIGILRAIGSRSNDVFRIFFAEAFIIAMINYVLSVAATLTVTIVVNNVLRDDVGMLITFLNFGVRQILLLLGVSLLVALVATFIPVKKIASMKPIDAIKNRK